MVRRSRRWLAALALLSASAVTACSGAQPPPPSPSSSSPPPLAPVTLTLGVFGPDDEVTSFRRIAEEFSQVEPTVETTVEVVSWPTRNAALRAYRSVSRCRTSSSSRAATCSGSRSAELIRPVDELLDQRGVSFGDGYSRDALAAFAGDNVLQCMPYSISPMVVYLNTDLVDFDRMARRQLDVPEQLDRWSFDQFTAAAQFATRPARGTSGVYVRPTLEQLAPFIYSGGGKVFDDQLNPTSLDFEDDGSQAALQTTLALLRNAQVTPPMRVQAEYSPVQLFEAGKVGMITGFRNLVPRFRATPAELRRDADAAAQPGQHGGVDPRLLPVGGHGERARGCRPDGPAAGAGVGGASGPQRLPGAGERRGRRLRRLPAAGSRARQLGGLHRQRPRRPPAVPGLLGLAGARRRAAAARTGVGAGPG
ncbi:MAG: extracellular solute-binding protein [Nocardioides sp.]